MCEGFFNSLIVLILVKLGFFLYNIFVVVNEGMICFFYVGKSEKNMQDKYPKVHKGMVFVFCMYALYFYLCTKIVVFVSYV